MPEVARTNYIYTICDFLGMVVLAFIVVMAISNSYRDYESKYDSIKVYYIVPAVLLIASFFNYPVSGSRALNICWVFSNYLNAVAIMPQLMYITKKVLNILC